MNSASPDPLSARLPSTISAPVSVSAPVSTPVAEPISFASLPIPFFSELAATLADRDLRRTLANLNETCKTVKEGTLAGLWKTCTFGETYDVKTLLSNTALAPLIKEVWLQLKMKQLGLTEDGGKGVLVDLREAFPNATTIMRTFSDIGPPKETKFSLVILVTLYSASCNFPLVKLLTSSERVLEILHVRIAPSATEGFKAAIGRQKVVVTPTVDATSEKRSMALAVVSASEANAVACVESLSVLAPVVSYVSLTVETSQIEDWYTQSAQFSLLSDLRAYPLLSSFEWVVNVSPRPAAGLRTPGAHTPNHLFLQHMATDLAKDNIDFQRMVYRLRFLDDGEKAPGLFEPPAHGHEWTVAIRRDWTNNSAFEGVAMRTEVPSGPFEAWE